jgi:2-dehydro-3-deoxyphosphogluconate aldolase/(4S)-4-hydroxy-2-oxoglutarate aldolase
MKMSQNEILTRLSLARVLPVVVVEKREVSVQLADALLDGGLPLVEITFRTAVAPEVIREIARSRPSLLVGAGTVLTPANLELAKASGAAFAVSPGLNPEMIKHAQKIGLPFIPGVATPTDIEAGLALGCDLLKFFPAASLGGVEMLEALSAPYRHTGIRFLPTGGINLSNLESYLNLDTVAAVGGTWIATKDDLGTGKWIEIRDKAKAAVEAVDQLGKSPRQKS